jgi:hypothetical protein
VVVVVPKRQRGVLRSDPRHIARLGRGFRDLKKCQSVQETNKKEGREIFAYVPSMSVSG